ncbi:hypothetical protein SVIO_006190 [Streptomyces violaceusniger]|uniref:Malonyl-CoA:ACP transacylase (MAT) domain-containing protein n=1 Tax=Streptomyces violaceusniger TaxID=68280 RepID=A0A4D4KSX7_STRVO|nr:hypothetical protein SVIO_006190 [Streptomyces violaceusniger]
MGGDGVVGGVVAFVWCGAVGGGGSFAGEIAAAVVAGGLSLVDGARVVVLRSRVIGEELAGCGGMLSVGLSAGRVGEFLAGGDGSLQLAAVNGPGSVVVSGAVGALEGLAGRLGSVGVRTRWIPVDYASHSGFVEGFVIGFWGSCRVFVRCRVRWRSIRR